AAVDVNDFDDDPLKLQVFARESLIDELAVAACIDPVEYRLRQMDDQRGMALIRNVADQAAWSSVPEVADLPQERRGRGFAYAHVVDDSVSPSTKKWSAWVADVAV